jgi:hypothetical protein
MTTSYLTNLAVPFETVVIDLSGTSPSSASTAAGANTITAGYPDLSNVINISIFRSIQGGTGGVLDIYLQCSPDGTNWYDWAHYAQQAAGASVTSKIWVPGMTNLSTTIGTGLTPALAADTMIGGHPGKAVRVVYVAGASTSAGAAQTIKLICVRPRV